MIMMDLEGLKEEVEDVKLQGEQLRQSCDPQGRQALDTTLTVLSDKMAALENQAKTTEQQLQVRKKKYSVSLIWVGYGLL